MTIILRRAKVKKTLMVLPPKLSISHPHTLCVDNLADNDRPLNSYTAVLLCAFQTCPRVQSMRKTPKKTSKALLRTTLEEKKLWKSNRSIRSL